MEKNMGTFEGLCLIAYVLRAHNTKQLVRKYYGLQFVVEALLLITRNYSFEAFIERKFFLIVDVFVNIRQNAYKCYV